MAGTGLVVDGAGFEVLAGGVGDGGSWAGRGPVLGYPPRLVTSRARSRVPSCLARIRVTVTSSEKEFLVENPGAGLADGPDAVTVASIAVTVLATSLPQPDYVSISPRALPQRELPVQRGQVGRRAVRARPRVGPVLGHPGPIPRR